MKYGACNRILGIWKVFRSKDLRYDYCVGSYTFKNMTALLEYFTLNL